jgi:hypothetical protein
MLPKNQRLLIVFLFLALAGSMTGCLPGPGSPTSRPQRKKMLTEDASGDGLERYSLTSSSKMTAGESGMPPPPFVLVDSTIQLGAENADFLVLRIPSTDMDFLLPMAKTYEPYLTAWLSAWPQLGRRGMAIDLSRSGKATHRSNFELTYAKGQVSFPVVLLWDDGGAERVEYFNKFAGSLSSIKCEGLNNQ